MIWISKSAAQAEDDGHAFSRHGFFHAGRARTGQDLIRTAAECGEGMATAVRARSEGEMLSVFACDDVGRHVILGSLVGRIGRSQDLLAAGIGLL